MADYKSEFTGAQIDDGIKKARSALQPTGATMTGPLILSGDPASAKEAATKEYVDGIAEKMADKEYIVSLFNELKELIQSGDTAGAVAVLDQAILDNSVLA